MKFFSTLKIIMLFLCTVQISTVISLSLMLNGFATANPTTSAIASSVSTVPTIPTYSKVYDDQRDPFKDASAAIALAAETNRQVLIEIGGNWCTWCHKMDTFLGQNPDVYHALHSQYVLLKVSVSDHNENEDFMKSLPPVLGYPHLYVSTGQGKMILSKDTAELLEGSNYSKQLWLTFLNEWSIRNTLANALLSHTKTSSE